MIKIQNGIFEFVGNIHNDREISMEFSLEEWHLLFEEAVNHNIEFMIYSYVKKYIEAHPIVGIEDLMHEWKSRYLVYRLQENIRYGNLSKLSNLLIDNKINHVFLKGFEFINLYPIECSRPMSDIDIYIKEEDYERSIPLLESIGYVINPEEESVCNIALIHPSAITIELHHHLFLEREFAEMIHINEDIFVNPRIIQYKGANITVPNINDHLVYIVLHLKKHLVVAGFGIRQLMDFNLYIQQYQEDIDFEYVISSLAKSNSDLFFNYLTEICIRYIGLTLKVALNTQKVIDEAHILLLVEFIFYSGVFGIQGEEHVVNNIYSNYLKDTEQPEKSWKKYQSIFFPPLKKVRKSYPVLNKWPILLPFIWVYRMYRSIVMRKDISFESKIRFLSVDNSDYMKKIDLVKFFDGDR